MHTGGDGKAGWRALLAGGHGELRARGVAWG
jgi:hypothetical protein